MPILSAQYALDLISPHWSIWRHIVGGRLLFHNDSPALITEVKLRDAFLGPLIYAKIEHSSHDDTMLYHHTVFSNGNLASICLRESQVLVIREEYQLFVRRARLLQIKRARAKKLRAMKRQAQQRAQQEEQRLYRARKPLRDLASEIAFVEEMLMDRETRTQRSLPRKMMLSDAHLVLKWAGISRSDAGKLDRSHLVEILGEYHAARLFSARAAEIVAMDYYRDLYDSVSDVSITQLDGSGNWTDFDILVSGDAIDVKNARRSFSAPSFYVEHCVPYFKTVRNTTRGVRICGVLSNYVNNFEEIIDDSGARDRDKYQILGETSHEIIQGIRIWIQRRFGHLFDLSGVWRDRYQPGWIFEFPDAHYPRRAFARLKVRDIMFRAKTISQASSVLPGWMLAVCPDVQGHSSFFSDEMTTTILKDLADAEKSIRIGRPFLFLYIMAFVLEGLQSSGESQRRLQRLRDLLMVSSSPLGLEDPQGYVLSLLSSLDSVIDAVEVQGKRFSSFRIASPDILRGRIGAEQEMTLFAYCGGFVGSSSVKCGFSPLVFGINESCSSCGHLICEKCQTCSRDCLENARRKQGIIEDDQVPF